MTFLHMESWLIRETGVVWRARAEQCLAQWLVSLSVLFQNLGTVLSGVGTTRQGILFQICEFDASMGNGVLVKSFLTDVGSGLL